MQLLDSLGIKWISRKGEIINHSKEAFKNFFTVTSEDKHLDF
jgi:hypothetical protein